MLLALRAWRIEPEIGGSVSASPNDDGQVLVFIHQDDQIAAELLVTLVTQGFFHGNF